MRFLKYVPLFGALNDRSTVPTDSATAISHHDIHQGRVIHDHHHGHHHQQVLHPTQKAYIAHLNNKKEAQKRLVEKRNNYRDFVVENHLEKEVVYPAFSSKQQSGGFRLDPGQEHTVQLPSGDLDMFRMWVRRGCKEGPGEGELHCLTGDCGGKLECEGWGKYGSTQFETTVIPSQGDQFPDLSLVEGVTWLPMRFSVNDCISIHCDPTGGFCPQDMQVLDSDDNMLACSCGASDWSDLQKNCPDHGGADVQSRWAKACPNTYTYSTQDQEGQKHCPFSEAGMRLDIGNPSPSTESAAKNPLQVALEPEKTKTKPIWGPGVSGFEEWAQSYKCEANT